MTKISATIVADSINEQGDRLTSFLITFPRILLSEINTHRMLSKNTSSSRAIPFAKMVETVKNDPFIPIAWQKHHSGMQGNEYWDVSIKGNPGELDHTNIPAKWLRARDTAVVMAEVLHDGPQGVTKQLCNRLLEPFMWTTMLITGPKSGWDNFFNLRCPQYYFEPENKSYRNKKEWIDAWNGTFEIGIDVTRPAQVDDWDNLFWLKQNKGQAEIHMMALAECIYDAMNESTPIQLKAGDWHIPFGDKMDISSEEYINLTGKVILKTKDLTKIKVKSSVAMAARTSYTVVGEEKALDYEALIGLHDRLLAQDPPHSSPLEHCARAMTMDEYRGNIKGKINLINDREFQTEFSAMTGYTPLSGACEEKALGWCNNFKGFIPYRYMVDNGKVD